jgi:hypothetical protein
MPSRFDGIAHWYARRTSPSISSRATRGSLLWSVNRHRGFPARGRRFSRTQPNTRPSMREYCLRKTVTKVMSLLRAFPTSFLRNASEACAAWHTKSRCVWDRASDEAREANPRGRTEPTDRRSCRGSDVPPWVQAASSPRPASMRSFSSARAGEGGAVGATTTFGRSGSLWMATARRAPGNSRNFWSSPSTDSTRSRRSFRSKRFCSCRCFF